MESSLIQAVVSIRIYELGADYLRSGQNLNLSDFSWKLDAML